MLLGTKPSELGRGGQDPAWMRALGCLISAWASFRKK